MQSEVIAYNMALTLTKAREEWSMPLSSIRFDIMCRIVSALLAHEVSPSARGSNEQHRPVVAESVASGTSGSATENEQSAAIGSVNAGSGTTASVTTPVTAAAGAPVPVRRDGVSHVDRVAAELLPFITSTWTQSRRFSKYVHHELRSHTLWRDLSFWSSTFVHMVQTQLRLLFAPVYGCKPDEVGGWHWWKW